MALNTLILRAQIMMNIFVHLYDVLQSDKSSNLRHFIYGLGEKRLL